MNELDFYNNDVGLDISDEQQNGGGGNDNLEGINGGDVIRKYRKRCLEHQKRITELEKENESLKQKIKELTK